MMIDKLQIVKQRFDEVADLIIQPDVIMDQKRYVRLNKEYKDLKKIVDKGEEYKAALSNIEEANEIIQDGSDAEMVEMAKMQLEEANSKIPKLEEDIKFLLIPKDPEDAKNVIVEIRAGTGGDEASIFAGDLYRMYTKFAADNGWKVELEDLSEGTSGGFKEIIFSISGEEVYGTMKFESGVHRVQRVPQTETQGRVHTSAATVMVLPEAEEFDIDLKMSDVRVDYFCASGPGGQGVNTTDSAVQIVHKPSGLLVRCADERSQIKNKAKAMKVLQSRLLDAMQAEQQARVAADRQSQVGSGDRSERIRTYNYPQGRVTDHRINLTLYKLAEVMEGSLDELVQPLVNEFQADQLAALSD